MKQIAAGIIPGPINISPPYPERWKKYDHDIKADKMLANAPCLVALFQYRAAKTTGNKAEINAKLKANGGDWHQNDENLPTNKKVTSCFVL